MHGKHPRAPGRSTRSHADPCSGIFQRIRANGRRETRSVGDQPSGTCGFQLAVPRTCCSPRVCAAATPGSRVPTQSPAQASLLHRSQTPGALGLGEKLAPPPGLYIHKCPSFVKGPRLGASQPKGVGPAAPRPAPPPSPGQRCPLASRPAGARHTYLRR